MGRRSLSLSHVLIAAIVLILSSQTAYAEPAVVKRQAGVTVSSSQSASFSTPPPASSTTTVSVPTDVPVATQWLNFTSSEGIIGLGSEFYPDTPQQALQYIFYMHPPGNTRYDFTLRRLMDTTSTDSGQSLKVFVDNGIDNSTFGQGKTLVRGGGTTTSNFNNINNTLSVNDEYYFYNTTFIALRFTSSSPLNNRGISYYYKAVPAGTPPIPVPTCLQITSPSKYEINIDATENVEKLYLQIPGLHIRGHFPKLTVVSSFGDLKVISKLPFVIVTAGSLRVSLYSGAQAQAATSQCSPTQVYPRPANSTATTTVAFAILIGNEDTQ